MDLLHITFLVINSLVSALFANMLGFLGIVGVGLVARFFWDLFTPSLRKNGKAS